jgi:ethanolamine transporter EutH
MQSRAARWVILALSVVIVFCAAVALGLKLTPEPRTETDYLVVGAVATFLAMVTLFVVLITAMLRTPNVFFRRRPRAEGEPGPDSAPKVQ